MSLLARSSVWIALYLGLVLLPFAILLAGERPAGGGLGWDFALALGYAGLAMMGVQFWLTARFKRASAPFGIDILYYFHRYLALVAFAVLTLHAGWLLLGHRAALGNLDPRVAPVHVTAGWVALSGFAAMLATSLWRKRLGLEYDRWRHVHVVLAVLATGAAVWHVEGAGYYLASPLKRGLWTALACSWLALVVYVRLVRPWRLQRQPYFVEQVRREPGRSWTLRLRPQHGARFDYRPGQFAWVTLRASPFAMREHPFSFSSSPSRGEALEFTIKELGDFTSRIGEIAPGESAFVDGPYGSFIMDRWPDAAGYVFIAGGVGIAPIISMLRALTDRSDPPDEAAGHAVGVTTPGERRPLWLFYGNRRWDRVVFRDELAELAQRRLAPRLRRR